MTELSKEVEQHFPWYVDSSDTDNLDCQCGEKLAGIGAWASHLAARVAHSDPDQPWGYCGDPDCESCLLLGLVEEES